MSHSLLFFRQLLFGNTIRSHINAVFNSPGGLLRSERDCRDRGFSHNALAGVSRQLCQGQSPFVVQSWSIVCPGRQCRIHPHLLPATMIDSDFNGTVGLCFKINIEMFNDVNHQPYLACINPKSSSPHEESSGNIPANPKIWQSGPRSWAWLWSVPGKTYKQWHQSATNKFNYSKPTKTRNSRHLRKTKKCTGKNKTGAKNNLKRLIFIQENVVRCLVTL